jgi:hypothetical protein
MKRPDFSKIIYVLLTILPACASFCQTLHLAQTLNYHRHIMDIEFSKEAPYSPVIYIYKIHPKEREAMEIVSMSDVSDSSSTEPLPKAEEPKPEVEYAVQIVGVKDSFALDAGEFPLYLNNQVLIGVSADDSIYKSYSINSSGIKCTGSLVLRKPDNFHSVYYNTTSSGKFYLMEKIGMGDSSVINLYDSLLRKVATIHESQPKSNISFIDDDKMLIINWTENSTSLPDVKEYSLAHGKIAETTIDAGVLSSFGSGAIAVNDTLILIYAQRYYERETMLYAMNMAGKIYWKAELPDYTDDITVLKEAKKIVCSFYNLQQMSTVRFFSLLTGKWQNTINLQLTIPEFAAKTKWPAYMPLRQKALAQGKFIANLINCYAPDNDDICNNYLIVSNGPKVMKTKLRKAKSITWTNITPLSENKLAVIIDDDIYYYSIY